jgi:hypothetical protein
MRVTSVLVAAAPGALLLGCAYHPGSYSGARPFAGEHVQAGCLDVAIERRADLVGDHAGAVLGYAFGNRCDHPATVDLARVPIVGRTLDGREMNLVAYDPHHELRPLAIDGRMSGGEAISYPSTVPFGEVCVDAASIAHEQPARWVCFARPDSSIALAVLPAGRRSRPSTEARP